MNKQHVASYFGLDRVLIYLPLVETIFFMILAPFFTFSRFMLAVMQGTDQPWMPFLEFRYALFLPGTPMPIGRWMFFVAVVLVFLLVSYVKLPHGNAIDNFQKVSIPTLATFWIAYFGFLGLFWLRIPIW